MAHQNRPGQSGPPAAQSRTQNPQSFQSTQSPTPQGASKPNVQEKANEATQRAAEKAQSAFESARNTATKQVTAVAQAFSSAADQLEQQEHGGLSERLKQYVRKAESASRYLENRSPRELKQDLEQFARQRPAWFLGGAFLAGLLGARFLKSSEKQSDSRSMEGSVEYARA